MRFFQAWIRLSGVGLCLALTGCLKDMPASGGMPSVSALTLADENANFCFSISSSGLRAYSTERDCRAVYGPNCSLEVFTRGQEQRLCHVHRVFALNGQPRVEFTSLTRTYSFGLIQTSAQFEVEIRNQGSAEARNCFANISNLNDFTISPGNLGTIAPNGGVRFRVIADPFSAQTPQTRTGTISVSCQSPSGASVAATSGAYSVQANLQNGGGNQGGGGGNNTPIPTPTPIATPTPVPTPTPTPTPPAPSIGFLYPEGLQLNSGETVLMTILNSGGAASGCSLSDVSGALVGSVGAGATFSIPANGSVSVTVLGQVQANGLTGPGNGGGGQGGGPVTVSSRLNLLCGPANARTVNVFTGLFTIYSNGGL